MTATEDRERSAKVLELCLTLKADEEDTSRQKRLDQLIAEFRPWDKPTARPMEYAAGWRFCVPSSFREALDIKLTPRIVRGTTTMKWTQGSWFHFAEGDTLYDSQKAYLPWDLKNFQICLDIRRASPAKPPNTTDRPARYPGVVIFDVLTPNEERTDLLKRREMAISQDEFVKLLIVGPPPEWREFLV
jgi:hypothetical protein